MLQTWDELKDKGKENLSVKMEKAEIKVTAKQLFYLVVICFFLSIGLILVIIGIIISGCKVFFEQLFYFFLCRHCLKCIIKVRKGYK
jgi:uncharacterized membrane protein